MQHTHSDSDQRKGHLDAFGFSPGVFLVSGFIENVHIEHFLGYSCMEKKVDMFIGHQFSIIYTKEVLYYIVIYMQIYNISLNTTL